MQFKVSVFYIWQLRRNATANTEARSLVSRVGKGELKWSKENISVLIAVSTERENKQRCR
jgi:hypothetical protein